MSHIYRNIIIFLISLLFVYNIYSLKNPVAVFCQYGGGVFYANSTGEYCIVDGNTFNAFNYYYGQVPEKYNFCYHYNLSSIIQNLTIDNTTITQFLCIYPNGTEIDPLALVPESSYQDVYPILSACNNIVSCSDTPWIVQSCSEVPYPCFNPPYIPGNYNSTEYNNIYSALYIEQSCGYCPENESFNGDWYRCPYNYSLQKLYNEFLKECPPPNNIEVNCYGVFTCIYNNQTSQIMTNSSINNIYLNNEENLTKTEYNNNEYNILPILSVIIIIIGLLIIILYYIK
ncbi:hypothetical protein MJ1_0108 [Nanobdella aerobiophila]|uniref:Uncharacterized protein n=1 Tax=Nanobdella aerobiophila TaxID=2586965 RepID=A0A915SCD1_9ARCH|nr:hypothetical protein [Nanobdella aerobiophila]BBL45283.1 hypothetical protein MJ1_0108 [Nanobdella aerobiophila]